MSNRLSCGARMRPSHYGSGVWVEPFWANPIVWAIVAIASLFALWLIS